MGIIEIILTIFAWRNGWKWRSLIPIGIAFALAFIVGVGIGASGGDPTTAGWTAIFDVCAIIALIVMVARKPAAQNPIDTTPKV